MGIFPILSICFGFIYFLLGVNMMLRNSKAVLNRLFLALSWLFALWAFTYAFVLEATDLDTAWFWYKLSSIGWCNFMGVSLHLAFRLTMPREKKMPWWALVLLYVPGALSSLSVILGYKLVATDFLRENGLLYEVYSFSLSGMAFGILYFGYLLFAFFRVVVWGVKSPWRREKLQARVFGGSVMIAVLPATLVNTLFPAMANRHLPAVGYLFILVWVLGTAVAIGRYKFMGITTEMASDKIFDTVRDYLVLTDPYGKILRVSREFQDLLGYSETKMRTHILPYFTDNPPLMAEYIEDIRTSGQSSDEIETLLKKSDGLFVPIRLSVTAIQDKIFQDPMGYVFSGEDLSLAQHLHEMNDDLELKNSELQEARALAARDLSMASHVQSSIFPQRPPESDDWDVSFFFQPATEVSGDFFDFYMKDGSLDGVCLFDVSGHGISSGLISLLARSLIGKAFYRNRRASLGKIFERFNEELIHDIDSVDNYLTGIILKFRGDEVEYTNAAHTDLFMRRSSSVLTVGKGSDVFRGLPLGFKAVQEPYGSLKFRVVKDDVLIIYSDGFLEGTNSEGEPFGEARLQQALAQAPMGEAEEILNAVVKRYFTFVGEAIASDDLTMMVLRRKR